MRRGWFTYRCDMSDGSADVALRDRSGQWVTVLRALCWPQVDEAEVGGPMLRVRFADGFEGTTFHNEVTAHAILTCYPY